ncbi:NADH-quinone oxidoreductase subunit C [Streptomyces sp. NPDC051310]|uniref:NADH-quinone oxidoreductase subunit C n=1 Tax=Streptomyces sp. NPDC051310 TaxID=3365649 RepID=UPI0037AA982F
MTAYDRLPEGVAELFGEQATAEHAYDLLTVDVPAASWITALETARDELGCTYFDWLSAVDEPATGFRVCAHLVALEGRQVRRLMLRTTVPHDAPVLPTAIGVYAGAAWHERETFEMFGVRFEGHPNLVHLLLPENFEGNPLRKDFVLAARVAKAWPGAKEPGESEHGGPKRRQMLPPGVPDPNEWGPLKGQLPPAPARPARERPARAAAGDRPVRRARTAAEGSASQAPDAPAAPARRARTAAEGSASQAPARRARSASEGSASQAPQAPAEATTAPPRRTRSTDAPWNNPRPAFEDTPEPPRPAPEPPATEPPAPESPASEPPASGTEDRNDTGGTSTTDSPSSPDAPGGTSTTDSPSSPDAPGGTSTTDSPSSPDAPSGTDGSPADGPGTDAQRRPEGDA